MALMNISIPIPEKRVTYKAGGKDKPRRVYHVVRRYRNSKGTPTAEERCIGKEDPMRPGHMIPNENFEKYYPIPKDVISLHAPRQVKEAGHIFFLLRRAQAIGLLDCLKSVFPRTYESILLMAVYMACEGNVMMNLDLFMENSLVPDDVSLNSQRSSELFSAISDEQRLDFFRRWKSHVLTDPQTLAYDVTSISTYADLPLAEYGYNRDKEMLPQLNLGLLYGADTPLPICYTLYSGSIVDKSFFPYMMRLSEELGVDDVFYIMDRGYLTKENLAFAKANNISFLMAAPKSQKIYRACLKEYASTLRDSRHHIPKTACYGLKAPLEIDDEPYRLYLYLNSKSAGDEEMEIFDHIDRLEEELVQLQKTFSLSRYSKYLDVERGKDKPVASFERNHDKINDDLSLAGMFCFLSNRDHMNAEEALKIYSRREVIEKAFDSLKNELDNDRFLTHTHKTTQGKCFVAFLSLILWADLLHVASEADVKIEKTLHRLLYRLKNIKRIDYQNGRSLLEPLTKKQKDILTAFDIDHNEFVDQILNFDA